MDHQINAKHSWNVRWLRESSPQKNQIIGSVTEAALREESDIDPDGGRHPELVVGNTKFKHLPRRLHAGDEVPRINFNANGGRQLKPTLAFHRTFTDQQRNRSCRHGVNDAYQFDNMFSWFIPGPRGDHSIRPGLQYEYVKVFSTAQDNWNAPSASRGQRTRSNPADPRTYPDRLSIRVPGPSEYTPDRAPLTFMAFVQDKWKVGQRMTLSLGVRYDLDPIPFQASTTCGIPGTRAISCSTRTTSRPRAWVSAYDLKGRWQRPRSGAVWARFYDRAIWAGAGNIDT